MTGFLGPNGAGKSTTMRLVLGLDAPTAGSVQVAGRRYATLGQPLRHVGALLESDAVHPARSARNHLRVAARSNGIPMARVDGVRWVRALVRRLADEGRTVLVSSHLLHEVQLVADHVLVIGRGRILADAAIQDVLTGHASLEDAYLDLTAGDVQYVATTTDPEAHR